MHVEASSDQRLMADALRRQVDQAMPAQEAIDRRQLDRATLLRIARTLADGGWLSAADRASTETLQISVLVALAETVADRVIPLPFPLIDEWAFIYAASCDDQHCGIARSLAAGSTLLSTQSSDWKAANATAVALPYAKWSDWTMVRSYAGKWELFFGSAAQRTVPYAEIDLTVPTWTTTYSGGPATSLSDRAQSVFETVLLTLQAASLVGEARSLLDRTVSYVKERRQFGVPVGSFQALKHRLADVHVEIETARSLVAYAAHTIDEDLDRRRFASTAAKALAAEVAGLAASEAIQLHGGMGFTWEGRLHYAARRIAFLSTAGLSPADCWREVSKNALGQTDFWEA